MRFAGIYIGAERHMMAVLDEKGEVTARNLHPGALVDNAASSST
jgi:hypothetical protein